ncbi:response regulator transcription factor [Pseudoxanthomonas wuyuanensis]
MRTEARPLKLLLVEDDVDIAAGIGDYLTAQGLELDFAYTAAQAAARLQEGSFDMVVMDAGLPDRDGIELCRSLKREGGLRSPVLFLTARGGLGDKLLAFEAGAVDYMVKPFAPEELLARVRAIAAHVPAGGGAQLRAGDYVLDLQGHLLQRAGRAIALHAAGFALIRRLMEVSPACVSHGELCALLWTDMVPGSDPLRMHIYQLRQACRRDLGTMPIVTVRGIGYRFVSGPDDAPA